MGMTDPSTYFPLAVTIAVDLTPTTTTATTIIASLRFYLWTQFSNQYLRLLS